MLHSGKGAFNEPHFDVRWKQKKLNEDDLTTGGSVCFVHLQQLFAAASLLHIHLQAAREEVSEDRRQLLRVLELWGAVGGDQVQSLQRGADS